MNGGKQSIRDGDYLLLELMSPTRAGSITGSIVAIERQDDASDNQYLLRVVVKQADGSYLLRANNPDYTDMPADDSMRTLARFKSIVDPLEFSIGQYYLREDIPPLFGTTFIPGNWNAGHIVLQDRKVHVLLVTLNKQGKAADHRYVDHWIDNHTFHWQCQNQTGPDDARDRTHAPRYRHSSVRARNQACQRQGRAVSLLRPGALCHPHGQQTDERSFRCAGNALSKLLCRPASADFLQLVSPLGRKCEFIRLEISRVTE
jgi:hypothetical protein